jgi:hypothetical protein
VTEHVLDKMYKHQNGNHLIAILSWHLLGIAEKNHENLIMVCLRTRLEYGSDFTALGSLYIVTSLLLQPFKQHLINITLFSLTIPFYSQSVSFKCTNNFGSIFTHHLDHRIYDTKFQTHISFPFSTCYLSHHFNFSFDAQNLPSIHDCSHVTTLPVSCSLQE